MKNTSANAYKVLPFGRLMIGLAVAPGSQHQTQAIRDCVKFHSDYDAG
jgi:hypothetical protein